MTTLSKSFFGFKLVDCDLRQIWVTMLNPHVEASSLCAACRMEGNSDRRPKKMWFEVRRLDFGLLGFIDELTFMKAIGSIDLSLLCQNKP